MVCRAKPLSITFPSNWAEFMTWFCLHLEIIGITLILPTKAALICSFFSSVVDLASLEIVQLCYFYTCWKLCVCKSPKLHNSDSERLLLLGRKEVLGAPAVNGSLQILICL